MIKKIKLLGKTIDINYVHDVNVSRTVLGLSCTGDSSITISANQTEENIEETLLHEIIHMVSNSLAIELNENQVTQVSAGLYSVYKENPGLIK